LRQVLPPDPGLQHEQDPGQDLPVRDPLATWVALAALHDGQQRLDALPELIGEEGLGHVGVFDPDQPIPSFCYAL